MELTRTDRPLKRRRTAGARVVPRRAERGIGKELTSQSRGPLRKQSFTRLLLVEDNPGDARLLSEMLNELGAHNIECLHLESMSEAEKHLALGSVDVVMLDLGLPDAQGLGAVRRARAAAPGIPLVVLTGLDDESLAHRALREGAQDYLVKGQIDARGLVRAVRYAIERKHAEEALRESESRYRALAGGSPLAVLVNSRGKVVLANPACMKLFGASSPKDLLGKSFLELCHPDSQAFVRDCIRNDGGPVPPVELQIVRLDGVPVYVEATASPTTDLGVNAVQMVLSDISVRKAAEIQLLQSELWYRTLADSLPHLVWTCRADGPCDYLSPRWVEYTGIPASDQLGYRWLEQLHPGDRDRVIAEWTEVAAHGESFDIEFRIRRADGAFRWFKTRAVPLRDNDGKLVKWFGSNSDIDDAKRAQEELRASNAASRRRSAWRTWGAGNGIPQRTRSAARRSSSGCSMRSRRKSSGTRSLSSACTPTTGSVSTGTSPRRWKLSGPTTPSTA